MPDKPNIMAENNEQREVAGLLDFFAKKGYANLQEVGDSDNYIFFGAKDGQEVFIKKFNRPTVANVKTNYERADTEIACYQHLPPEFLIDFIEANKEDHYIVLKKVNLEDIPMNEETVPELIDFGLNFFKFDASYLPEWSWHDYEKKVFHRLEQLQAAGAALDAEKVKQLFINNQELIKNSPKGFSHLDFNLLNVKKYEGKLVVFDFENAHQDNAMVDMAILYIQICDDKELKKKFQETIAQSDLYNEELLKLMVIRRSTIVLHAGLWANNDLRLANPFRQKNYDELIRLCNGESLFE